MTTPDAPGYNDLRLYDRAPSELVARAVLDAVTKLPAWKPTDGNVELVLLEAMALQVAELVYTANRLPLAIVNDLQSLYGITRDPGTAPSGVVTFTLADTAGYTVPAGSVLRLIVGGGTAVDWTLNTDAVAASGTSACSAAATASVATDLANGTPDGTVLQVLSPLPMVDSARLSAVQPGVDPETDQQWRDRGVRRFARLSEVLVLTSHFTDAALETAGVARATTVDQFNGTATAAGHVTVAVLGPSGTLLSGSDKAALAASLQARSISGLTVHVIDPTITTVNVTATVKALPGTVGSDVQAAAVTALQGYLSSLSWGWSATVRRFDLVALLKAVPGVDFVVSVTTPAADVALSGAAPLATLGTATVTVT